MPWRHLTEKDVEGGFAGADLRFSQFRCVVRDGNGKFIRAGVGADVYGVLENNPELGLDATVFIGGDHEAIIATATGRDVRLVPDAEGRLRTPPRVAGDVGTTVRTYYRLLETTVAPDQVATVRREIADVVLT